MLVILILKGIPDWKMAALILGVKVISFLVLNPRDNLFCLFGAHFGKNAFGLTVSIWSLFSKLSY